MVFINKKYGVRSMNGPLSDEVAKALNDFMRNAKEERMTKKIFTEKEYQTIVEIADKQIKEHNRSVITATSSFLETIRWECQKVIDYDKLWDLEQEFIIICLPKYREWAHDKFVEKEKKYFWKSKKTDKNGQEVYITDYPEGYPQLRTEGKWFMLTESNIRKWGYNPDMFVREEVE